MTPHDAIRESIPDLLVGRLEPGEAIEVESHLASCEECAALAHGLREIVAGFCAGGMELVSPHPDPDALRRAALGGLGDAATMRHVETCAPCSLEVEIHRASSRQAQVLRFTAKRIETAPTAFLSPRTWLMPASLAAMFVVGLGLGVLYRPLEEPGDGIGAGAAAPWSGAVRLVLLEHPLRGGAERPSFTVPPGQPYVPLATPLTLDAAVDDSASVRFELRNASGRITWSATVEAGEVRSSIRSSGVMTLLVPAAVLEPGDHSLSAKPEGGTGALLDVIFEVRP